MDLPDVQVISSSRNSKNIIDNRRNNFYSSIINNGRTFIEIKEVIFGKYFCHSENIVKYEILNMINIFQNLYIMENKL